MHQRDQDESGQAGQLPLFGPVVLIDGFPLEVREATG
jgi:hypothetical protein